MKKTILREIQYAIESKEFIEKLESVKATVCKIESRSEVIKEVHRYTVENQINKTITVADVKTAQGGNNAEMIMQYESQAISTNLVFALMGIEETGSLVILPNSENQAGMSFFPERYIVVVDAKNIVKTMNDAWQVLCSSGREFPNMINLLTGTPMFAETEHRNQASVCGQKYLHVILIEPTILQ